jgi:hypothetical protein
VRVPVSIVAALAITAALTVTFGISNLAPRLGDVAEFVLV